MQLAQAQFDMTEKPVRFIAPYREKIRRDTARRTLAMRTSAEWLALIAPLAPEVAHACACVIWWDFFGSRLVPERIPAFDVYLNKRVPAVKVDDLIAGLIACGYPEDRAARRVMPTDAFFNRRKTRVLEFPDVKEAA